MTVTRNIDRPILQRIADALGIEVSALSDRHANAETLHDTLELLTAFEDVHDLRDRRACLDFVRSVTEQPRKA
ncbi:MULTISPECIES: hypothetical protein [Methylobacterium]|jgi:hypothetical protein|uniref:XRE family transcriptional regulator n=1 Tax=Methylobacterium longum TaxID=767694 RepID=A0ABT8ANV1_9HYPH|nr:MULTISPECIES: hypothetical protein [Methylobacterium]MCJ2099233.1 hypothetical protein [Methylobacterium sp. E-046]MDN3571567.1 hypothetical protein [Methylobacterium longum]GJE14849.1 hypothetical protein FOHLNKBM_5924 [Methylobacterium longum]